MKNTLLVLLGIWMSTCNLFAAGRHQAAASNSLWYAAPVPPPAISLPWEPGAERDWEPGAEGDKQIKVWESQTLPIGNGRVGATCYSGIQRDYLLLNENSLWSGGQNLPNNGAGYNYGPKSGKNEFGSYQPFAHLVVEYEGLGKTEDYRRTLQLDQGTLSTTFVEHADLPAKKDKGKGKPGKKSKNTHQRLCYVSHPDNVLVYTANATFGNLNARVALLPFHSVSYQLLPGNVLCMKGTLANGEAFEGRIMVLAEGGSVAIEGQAKTLEVDYKNGGRRQRPTYSAEGVPFLSIKGAKSFTLIVSLATDYKMSYKDGWKGSSPAERNDKILAALAGKSPADLLKAHINDFSSLYNRMSIKLGETDPKIAALPTNERLARYREGAKDPELEALIYQLGRYMLISGSRPGNLPLTLQGIWNDKVHAPWACDYHNNINLQMCYWGAEVANLSECHMTFIDFIRAMEQPLHEMTQKHFGSHVRGWTTRISQNPWGGGGWSKWNPPVNAWYALHVWDHYLFTQDKNYLEQIGYPILQNICNFWEDRLKELGEHGEGLVSNGAPMDVKQHPELKDIRKGTLVSPDGWSHEWGPVEDGCMHDQQLIWELFDNTAKAAAILGKDAEWIKTLEEKKNRLAPNRIGRDGYLQEWIVDRPDMVSGHRHTSHLIGVFPGSTISMARTPALAKAAMKSLELRGVAGDSRRSWTWPWRAALWARFHNSEKAYEMVQSLLRYNMLENLMADHLPPMQMDGTYGITGAISEMLVQSHAGQIELLPALPAEWKNGSVRGLRARGDITIDMIWKNGKVTKLKLYSSQTEKPVTVIKNGAKTSIVPKALPAELKSQAHQQS